MIITALRSYGFIIWVAGSILLSACSSTPTSTSTVVSVRDIDAASPVRVPDDRLDTPAQAKSTPVYQERAPKVLPIVERIFKQADEALQKHQWSQAIAFAEKGLRIERKEPRFYWVLASAYARISSPRQSQSFARQGLRYADKNSLLARDLKHYLP